MTETNNFEIIETNNTEIIEIIQEKVKKRKPDQKDHIKLNAVQKDG